MSLLDFSDEATPLDEAELEVLSEYLAGRLTHPDEEALEHRLGTDRAFRTRVRPILQACFKEELSPIEREIAQRLAERGVIQLPRIKRRERLDMRRPLDERRDLEVRSELELRELLEDHELLEEGEELDGREVLEEREVVEERHRVERPGRRSQRRRPGQGLHLL